MQYLITFLEGIISFISPCMLPMLPLYFSYFAGNEDDKQKPFPRAFAFFVGFTAVFTLLGLLAGTLSTFLVRYKTVVNVVSGLLAIVFGLSYLGVIRIPFFKGIRKQVEIKSIFSAFLFGIVFAVGLTPCVGAFLGSALMMASISGGSLQGTLLLLTYSLGMGLPFLISALLTEKLGTTFDFIKKHYKTINIISGVFLIILGILMVFGVMSYIMAFFTI